ncbi:MAG TPA: hypothetical protein VGR45_04140 [Stellaceae bacterium]|nr:hypothetical protein [Stellaceae bacterium]
MRPEDLAKALAQLGRASISYLHRGKAEAAKPGVPCRWRRVVVPGVAHEGMRMSAFAGDYWFGAPD